MKLQIFKVEVS